MEGMLHDTKRPKSPCECGRDESQRSILSSPQENWQNHRVNGEGKMTIGQFGPKFKLDGITLSLGAIVVIAILAWWFLARR